MTRWRGIPGWGPNDEHDPAEVSERRITAKRVITCEVHGDDTVGVEIEGISHDVGLCELCVATAAAKIKWMHNAAARERVG